MPNRNAQDCRALASEDSVDAGAGCIQRLGEMRAGSVGRILTVSSRDRDVERGLLEMGFMEGACIEVLHYGFLGRDPLAIRINQTMTVALRRCEANAVLVGPLLGQGITTKSVTPFKQILS